MYGCCCLWLLVLATAASAMADPPQQIHVSCQSPGSATVMWATNASTASSMLWIGTARGGPYASARAGTQEEFVNLGDEMRAEWFHTAVAPGLAPRTVYYYRVGDPAAGVSDEFAFQALPAPGDAAPMTFLAIADFGLQNDRSMAALTRRVQGHPDAYNFLIHAGDEAYDLFERDGRQGDDFMNLLQPVAANIVYQIGAGNHEVDPLGLFHDYKNRYAMPQKESAENMWWSLDVGLVHTIMLSSEHWFDPVAVPFLEVQLDWLVADLKAAVANRARVPWILVFIHRPMYCSNAWNGTTTFESDCAADAIRMRSGFDLLGRHVGALEPILLEYGVDLFMCGHEHSFETTWPVADGVVRNGTADPDNPYNNPGGLPNIVAGNAGNREDYDPFSLGPQGSWSAFRRDIYGFGVFTVHNATHLTYEAVDDANDEVFYTMELVRTHHEAYAL